MFNNIGKKIKAFAIFFASIGFIISLIAGITLLFDSGFGILIIIIGCLGSWISSIFFYGFGELIENSNIIVSILSKDNLSDNRKNARNTVSVERNNKLKEIDRWKKDGLILEEEFEFLKDDIMKKG